MVERTCSTSSGFSLAAAGCVAGLAVGAAVGVAVGGLEGAALGVPPCAGAWAWAGAVGGSMMAAIRRAVVERDRFERVGMVGIRRLGGPKASRGGGKTPTRARASVEPVSG